MMNLIQKKFTEPLLSWYDTHGRKNLPWQKPRTAYHVWLSEIMLQQTQVKTVIPYFTRFIERFPDVHALALASEDDILALWSGLGYYSRGRNLHKTALKIHTEFQGIFPKDQQALIQLPGIGESTAAAIISQAFNQPSAILDGNVKRVLSRYFLIEGISKQTTNTLWQLANQCLSPFRAADYTQAIMDFGATNCTSKQPQCIQCPLQTTCLAHLHDVVQTLPTKKPKKVMPVKHQQFLLMHHHEKRIYLEKRPPTGIWGGLWCLPSIDNEENPAHYIETTYQLKPIHINPIMTIKHTFTHFKLYIKAISIETQPQENASFELPGRWFYLEEIRKLGLAKPVSDIIRQFYQSV